MPAPFRTCVDWDAVPHVMHANRFRCILHLVIVWQVLARSFSFHFVSRYFAYVAPCKSKVCLKEGYWLELADIKQNPSMNCNFQRSRPWSAKSCKTFKGSEGWLRWMGPDPHPTVAVDCTHNMCGTENPTRMLHLLAGTRNASMIQHAAVCSIAAEAGCSLRSSRLIGNGLHACYADLAIQSDVFNRFSS